MLTRDDRPLGPGFRFVDDSGATAKGRMANMRRRRMIEIYTLAAFALAAVIWMVWGGRL